MLGAAWVTAIATAGLLVGAVVTAIFAVRAFREQAREVKTIEQQARHQQELIGQQGELLRVQSGQMDLQRQQLLEQRAVNEKLAAVADLQAEDLRASLAERVRSAAAIRRAQASRVFLAQEVRALDQATRWFMELGDRADSMRMVAVTVRNTSDQPVYDTELRWQRGSAPYGEPPIEPLGTVLPGNEVAVSRTYPAETNFDVAGGVVTFRDSAGVTWMRRRDGELLEWPHGQGVG